MTHKLLAIAQSEIGVREQGGNNRGQRIREYQSATELAPDNWAWCAAFVDFCIRQWVSNSDVVKWLDLQSLTPEQWRPKTALAYGLTEWAKSRPKTTSIYTDKDTAQPGDIVTFDFSHVGIVLEDGGDTIVTVEGNTNVKGQRESESGDGVWRKIRAKSLARDFIRIHPRKKA
jgi:hypothetical protein